MKNIISALSITFFSLAVSSARASSQDLVKRTDIFCASRFGVSYNSKSFYTRGPEMTLLKSQPPLAVSSTKDYPYLFLNLTVLPTNSVSLGAWTGPKGVDSEQELAAGTTGEISNRHSLNLAVLRMSNMDAKVDPTQCKIGVWEINCSTSLKKAQRNLDDKHAWPNEDLPNNCIF